MTTLSGQTHTISWLSAWFVSAVAVALSLVAGFRGVSAHLVPLALAGLLVAGAALPLLLRPRGLDLPEVLPTVTAAGIIFLILTQTRSVSGEISLPYSWVWIIASLTAVTAAAAARAGRAREMALALALPSAIGGLYTAWCYGVLGQPPTTVRDPNVSADAVAILLLVTVALVHGTVAERDATLGRRGRAGLILLVVLIGLTLSSLLSARATMALTLVGLGVVVWPMQTLFWRTLPLWLLGSYLLPYLLPLEFWFGVRAPEAGSGGLTQQLDARWASLVASWQFFLDSPLTGTGLMSFSFLFPPVRSADLLGTGGYMVHNDWMQLLQEAGLPFVLALLLITGLVARAGWRNLAGLRRERPDPAHHRLLAHAAFVSVALVLVHALVNFPLYDPALLSGIAGLAALGCIIASGHAMPASDDETASAEGAGQTHAVAKLAVALLAVVLLFSWSRLALMATGLVVLGSGVPFPGFAPIQFSAATQFAVADRLATWAPGFSGAPYAQAYAATVLLPQAPAEQRRALVEFGIDAYERAIELNPYLVDYYVQYARLLREGEAAPLGGRVAILRAGLARDPLAPQVWLALARELAGAGQGGRLQAMLHDEWLVTCPYASLRAPQLAVDTFRMISASAQPSEAYASCDAILRRRGLL